MSLGQFENWGGVLQPDVKNAEMDWMNRLTSFGQAAMTAMTNAEYMRDLNAINLERARQGLAPLSPSDYAPTVNVGISGDTQKVIIGVGVGLLALFALRALAR